jgi:hypothetical protein
VYTADSNPEFVEVDSASLNLESGSGNWAARIGVLRVFVNRSIDDDGNQSNASNDDSAYVKALYFRDANGENNHAVLYLQDNHSIQFPAKLQTRLVSVASGDSLDSSVVTVYGNVEADSSHDNFIHLLPASYRAVPSMNKAIYSPGDVSSTDWLETFTLEFWLTIIGEVPSEYVGHSLLLDQSASTFSSISSLAISHNYNPSSYAGSALPTDNLGGDLAFFPSENYNKAFSLGQSSSSEKNCWLIFETNQTKVYGVPTVPLTLGKLSALLYGPGIIVGSTDNAINYSIFGAHSVSGSDQFRLVKTTADGIEIPTQYISYKLKFRDVPVVSGETVLWNNLAGGAGYSSSNSSNLIAYEFDQTYGATNGSYRDTITVSITSIN